MAVSANRLELLQIADAVAREKSIDRTIVITAMEDAIAKAARSRYGAETDVHAGIDAKLVLTDALIAESLRRGKQAELQRQTALNDNQPAAENSAASSQHQNPFQREPGQSRHRAQHEGE